MERRLSAIFAADMVGYSRLMEADEIGTLERQKKHRGELINPAIEEFHGRIVKEMGDGILLEFPSVVDAVQCAVVIQREMLNREVNVSDDRRIQYRMGINLGDVVIENDDIFGDGVNVAARLEQLADPGGICISGTTYDQLTSKVEAGYESLGEINIKNIQRPIRAYRVLIDPDQAGEIIGKKQAGGFGIYRLAAIAAVLLIMIIGGGGWWWSQQPGFKPVALELPLVKFSDKPSIAVLPFDNMSNDPEQEYFSDGMTEDLITDLSQVSGLFVIARNSTFTYKDKAVKVQQVGRELGVKYVLEGSIRKIGSRIRINAQLIDVRTGGHLWAQRYDRNLTDVFALQDEVVKKIVSALAVTLNPREQEQLANSSPVVPEAYDKLLLGLEKFRRFTAETNLEAREYFELAIAIDPTFARAHADLALTYAIEAEQQWTKDPESSAQRGLEIANHALNLDNSIREVYFVLSIVYRGLKRISESVMAARKAIKLSPNYADGHTTLALSLNYAGNPEEGLAVITRAMNLNPLRPFFYVWTEGQSHYLRGNYEKAVQLFEQVITTNPQFSAAHKMLVATYIELGRKDDAEWAFKELLTIAPNFRVSTENIRAPYIKEVVRRRYIKSLRQVKIE